MSDVIVYHGGTETVTTPISKFGRKNLDFGRGFYVTDIREQAVNWALSVARNRNKAAVLNVYRLNRNAILSEFRCKVFQAYDEEWLQFIVANRSGVDVASQYDYVEGGVANDRVIDTVNLYISGLMDLSVALRELSKHRPNNQMCIISQNVISKYITYERTELL